MNYRIFIFQASLVLAIIASGCKNAPENGGLSSSDPLLNTARTIFRYDPESAFHQPPAPFGLKELLGQMLYHDPRLSKSGFISCNSCHNLSGFGADRLPLSPGHKWQKGTRNSPSTLNAFLHADQFWDGREKTIEDQAIGPILNSLEMAMPDERQLLLVLNSVPEYQRLFAEVYPGEAPLNRDNLVNALGAFERRLVSPAPFHSYLAGNANALTPLQLRGLEDFISIGCATCHLNETLGGMSFARFLPEDFPQILDPSDKGRYEVTGDPGDEYFFKVPSLLNVVHTYPYFHNGSVWELNEAIRIIAETQLDLSLQEEQLISLVHFMEALTGEISPHILKLPLMPPLREFNYLPDLD